MKNALLIIAGILLFCMCVCVLIFGGAALLIGNIQPTFDIPSEKMTSTYLKNLDTIPGYVEIDPGNNTFISDPRISTKLFTPTINTKGVSEVSEYIVVQTGEAILDPSSIVEKLDEASCGGKVSSNLTNGVFTEYKGSCADSAYYFLEKTTENKVILFETYEMGKSELDSFIKVYIGN